ncbi:hypothetical protein GCM10028807_30260 [Spirosoma daeguense]
MPIVFNAIPDKVYVLQRRTGACFTIWNYKEGLEFDFTTPNPLLKQAGVGGGKIIKIIARSKWL